MIKLLRAALVIMTFVASVISHPAAAADLLVRIDDRATEMESPDTYLRLLEVRKEALRGVAFAVRVDPATINDGFMALPVASGGSALFQRHEPSAEGPRLNGFYGIGVSGGAVQALLHLNATSITGFYKVNKEHYSVEAGGSGYSIVQLLDLSKAPPMHGPDDESTGPLMQDYLQSPGSIDPQERKRPLEVANAGRTASIDILVVYTPSAVSTAGGLEALNNKIQTSNENLNRGFANSQVYARSNVVAIVPVNFPENTSFGAMKASAMANPNITALRRMHKADVVVLMTGLKTLCGLATLASRQPETAYAVVSVDNICLDTFAFAHEVGNILGTDHDPLNITPPGSPYPYGHGYVHLSATNYLCYKTIMAYASDCNDVERSTTNTIPYFSNPTIVYYLGQPPIGNTVSNNAKVLNENVLIVASFDGGSSITAPATSEASLGAITANIITAIMTSMPD